MVVRLGRGERHDLSSGDHLNSSSVLVRTLFIRRTLRHFGAALREMFKRNRPVIYEPDPQRLAELVTGLRGASPMWCGGCGQPMTPIAVSEGDQTRLVAITCLNPCAVSLAVRAGLLTGGEPVSR
jgi:hypothetical protein